MGTASRVGAVQLPLAAGAVGATVADPLVVGLADYLAWHLNNDLSARFGQHYAKTPSYAATAVPPGNAFAYSPLAPWASWVKLPVPGLWIWWEGEDAQRDWTLVYRVRERELRALYVWDELPANAETVRRAGIANAVAACLHRACARGRHASYAYGTSPAGMPLYQALGARGELTVELLGCAATRFGIGDPATVSPGVWPPQKSGQDFPAVAAKIKVQELVTGDIADDPGDVAQDLQVDIDGSDGESAEITDVLDRILACPDGSDE